MSDDEQASFNELIRATYDARRSRCAELEQRLRPESDETESTEVEEGEVDDEKA
jgi:hypothetical protein